MFPFTTLLVSIGAISGIATFLAILMVIADATIANYGTVKITANGERIRIYSQRIRFGRKQVAGLSQQSGGVFLRKHLVVSETLLQPASIQPTTAENGRRGGEQPWR